LGLSRVRRELPLRENTRRTPGAIRENASRGDVVGNVIGARGMRIEANNFEILRVNLLARFVVAVGANVAIDGDLISDIHLVDQEAADLCIEGVGGEKLGALLFLADFWSVQNSSTATVTTVFAAFPENCRGFCETLPEMTKKLREVMAGSVHDAK
jgi:hypothetical protein